MDAKSKLMCPKNEGENPGSLGCRAKGKKIQDRVCKPQNSHRKDQKGARCQTTTRADPAFKAASRGKKAEVGGTKKEAQSYGE